MTSRSTSRKKKTQSKPQRSSNMALWLIAASAVGLVVMAIWFNTRQIQNIPTATEAESAYKEIPTEWINGRTLGNPDAPVTIQAWEDFM